MTKLYAKKSQFFSPFFFLFFFSFEKREKRMAKLFLKKDFAREEFYIYSSHKDGKGGTENRDDHRRVRIRGRRRRRCGHESVHGYVSLSLLLCLEDFCRRSAPFYFTFFVRSSSFVVLSRSHHHHHRSLHSLP